MKRLYAGIFCICIISFSCSTKSPLNNIVCLVDFSKSIPASTLLWYENIIQDDIIKNLGEKDKITILPIDYGSQTSSTEIFRIDFETEIFRKELDSPLQQERIAERRLNIFRDSLKILLSASFEKAKMERRKFSQGTDVVGGVKQANKYILEGQNNLIIILSDMLNETEELNLFRGLSSSNDIKGLLKRIKIPTLNKADVLVMTGEQPNIKIEKYKLLKEFWEFFFSKTNLSFVDYESGGENILVNKINSYKNSLR
jgi:hypothetical protein